MSCTLDRRMRHSDFRLGTLLHREIGKVATLSNPSNLSAQEMTEIVRAIYDMMGKYTYPALTGDVPQQHVDAFFQVCV